jgi:XTP/dITP diphosphohydrolase
MEKIVVATSNKGKLVEMEKYLQNCEVKLVLKPSELEIEETGETFMANACLKASETAKFMREWSIADDSGLMVSALDGKPGIYSARYGKTDGERINRLLMELGNNDHREAQFVCAIAIANPKGEIVLQTEGICKGKILKERMGEGGFGYDPIFYVPSAQKSFAQMSPELKKEYSHRGNAFKNLEPLLKSLLAK